MFGSIMPEPFAMPWIVIEHPPILSRVEATLAWVSVVRIASAAPAQPALLSAAAACGMPRLRISSGNGWPITPVEATSISSSGQPTASAARRAIVFASRIPRAPIATFEQPLFTTTPRARPLFARSRETSTGAPTTLDWVNTAATLAELSETIIARSGALALIPEWRPTARNPATGSGSRRTFIYTDPRFMSVSSGVRAGFAAPLRIDLAD